MKNTKVKDIDSTIFFYVFGECFYPHMWMNSTSAQRSVVLWPITLQLSHFHDKTIMKIEYTRPFALAYYTLKLRTVFEAQLYYFLLPFQLLIRSAISLEGLPPFLEVFKKDGTEFLRLCIR